MHPEISLNNSAQSNVHNQAEIELTAKEHTSCIHCGQILISKADQQSGFCCNGCKAVYKFINNLGLADFYCIRENSDNWKTSPATESDSAFSYFNDSNFLKEFIEHDESTGISLLKLQIGGLHCSACVWLLEKLKDIMPGLTDLRVNILSSRAEIKYDPQLIKPAVIAATIKAIGYDLQPISPDKNISSLKSADRELAVKLGIAAFCAMNVMLLFIGRYQGLFSGIEKTYADFFAWTSMILTLPAVFYSATPFYKTSLAALKQKRLHIDFPISIAITGGFIASCINTVLGRSEIYFDTVTALVFLLLCGRWCQRKALNKASDISDMLYSFAPLSALVKAGDGKFTETYTSSIKTGDIILIPSKSAFPCDGIVIKGSSHVNNSLLSGESRLVKAGIGSDVWAGAVNEGSELTIEASSSVRSSRFGNMISDLKNAPLSDCKTARFVDRISKYFVFAVLGISAITFCIMLPYGFWHAWDRVIALLVVSCPCALGIATPVTLSLASASAAKKGILFRTPEALEKLSEIKKVIFDKTGTLTQGKPGVADIIFTNPAFPQSEIWNYLHALEADSRHPAGICLYNFAKNKYKENIILKDKNIIQGCGVSAVTANGKIIRLGSVSWITNDRNLLTEKALTFIKKHSLSGHTLTGLSVNGAVTALFSLSDSLRIESSNVIKELNMLDISSSILSGDSQAAVQEVASKLNIPLEGSAEQSPEEKAEIIKNAGEFTAFAGDGANDALALKYAYVGIAVAGGAEISLKTADVFLSKPNLLLLTEAVRGAKKTLTLVRRHLFISLIYNITAGTLAVMGLIGPLAAAFVMPASSLTVILSSILNIPFREKSR